MADGIAYPTSLVPFPIRVVNLSPHGIQLNKDTLLGSAHMDIRHVVGIIEVGNLSARLRTRNESTLLPQLTNPEWASEMDLGHLSEESRVQFIETLTPFARMWDGNLGEINTTHRIELTPGAKPVFKPPYRAGKAGREVKKREIEMMLTADVIEPAASEWASPMVLITKKDGDPRFCVDYRRVNELTRKDSYPLPRMDECLDSLKDAGIFTTLDCNSGYWQILIFPEDRDKTAFVSHKGIYCFKRMPFGLVNALATF
jgi:hypothetical protein